MATDGYISTFPPARVYNYYRHEHNLFKAVEKTGYSYLKWYWIGGDEQRRKWFYMPVRILSPVPLYVDFNGKRPNVQRRKEKAIEQGLHVLYVNTNDDMNTMYAKIMMELRRLGNTG